MRLDRDGRGRGPEWDEVAALARRSCCLIAPNRLAFAHRWPPRAERGRIPP